MAANSSLLISIDSSGVVTGQRVATASLESIKASAGAAAQGLDLVSASSATVANGANGMSAALAKTIAAQQEETRQLAGKVAALAAGTQAEANYAAAIAVRNALIQSGAVSLQVATDQLIVNDAAAVEAITATTVAQAALNAQLAAMSPAADTGSAGLQRLDAIAQRMLIRMVLLGIVIALADVAKNAIESATAFESSMMRLQTLVGVSQQEADSYRASILQISQDTGQSADDDAKAMFAITSAGLRGQEALDALDASAKGAAIGLGDQTTVARAAVSAMVAYGGGTLTASEALDVIIGTAREGNVQVDQLAGAFGRVTGIAATVGISFQEVGAAIATMTRMGVNATEAVTGIRGLLSALELKSAATAEPALKAVGMSLAGLRQEIQDKGLAAAMVDLVSKFNGNTDALSKIIPNVRSLAEVLGTAKSQASEYPEILQRITDGMGSATEKAFELQQSNPGTVFEHMKTDTQNAAMAIGEQLLPQLVAFAKEVSDSARNGDFSQWATIAKIAVAGVIDVLKLLSFTLSNLGPILIGVAAWMLGARDAELLLIASTTALEAGFKSLTAAIAANPFGAAVIAGLALRSYLSGLIDDMNRTNDAFEAEIAKENKDAIAVHNLAVQFDGLATARNKALPGSTNVNNQVLSTAPDSYVGQLQAINKAYDDGAKAAEGNKAVLAELADARRADADAVIKAMNVDLDAARNAKVHADANIKEAESALAAASANLLKASSEKQEPYTPETGGSYTTTTGGPGSQEARDAQAAYLAAENALVKWQKTAKDTKDQIAALAGAIKTENGILNENGGAIDIASKAAENLHAAILEQVKGHLMAADAAIAEADATMLGTQAVKDAATMAKAQKQIEEDVARAVKDKTTVTQAEKDAIIAATVAQEHANDVLAAAKLAEADDLSYMSNLVANKLKVTDAINQNTYASMAGNIEERTRQSLIKAGLDDDTKLSETQKDLKQFIIDLMHAKIEDNAATMATDAATKFSIKSDEDSRKAKADLTDAINRNKAASQELTIVLAAEKLARDQNIKPENLAAFLAETEARLRQTQVVKDYIPLITSLNKIEYDASLSAAEIADLKTKIGLQEEMPGKVGNIVVKYAAYKTAVEAVTAAHEIQALVAEAGANADVDAITKLVEAEHKYQDALANEKAVMLANQQAAKESRAAIVNDMTQAAKTLETAIIDAASGVAVKWHDVVAKMVKDFVTGIIDMQLKAQESNLANLLFGGGNSSGGSIGTGGQDLKDAIAALREAGTKLASTAPVITDSATAASTSIATSATTSATAHVTSAATSSTALVGAAAVQSSTAATIAALNASADAAWEASSAAAEAGDEASATALETAATALDDAAANLDTSSATNTASSGGFLSGIGGFLGGVAVFAVAVGLMMSYVSSQDAKLAANTFNTQGDIGIFGNSSGPMVQYYVPGSVGPYGNIVGTGSGGFGGSGGGGGTGIGIGSGPGGEGGDAGYSGVGQGAGGGGDLPPGDNPYLKSAITQFHASLMNAYGAIAATINDLTPLGKQFTSGIKTFMLSLETAMGGLVTSLPNISLLVSQDGKKFAVTVGGALVGYFNNLQDATNAGIMAGLKGATFSGVGKAIEDYIKNSLDVPGMDPQTLLANVTTLSGILHAQADALAGAGAAINDAMQKIIDTAQQEYAAVVSMGISGADLVTFIKAIGDAESYSIQQERDSLTGKKETNKQIQQEEAAAFNAKLAIAQAQVQTDILTVRGQIQALLGMVSFGNGVITLAELLVQTTIQLSAAGTDYANALIAQYNALLGVASQLNAIKPIDPKDIVVSGGSATSSITSLATAAQDLATALTALREQGMSPYDKALDALNQKYKDEEKGLKASSKAYQDLELARAAEIKLLQEQTQATIDSSVTPLIQQAHGLSTFQIALATLNQTWSDTYKTAKEMGDGEKELARIRVAQLQAERNLILQTVDALNLPIDSTSKTAQQFADAILALNTGLHDGAISASEFNKEMAQITNLATSDILTMIEGIYTSIGDSKDAEKYKEQLQQINFEIQLAQLQVLAASLLAVGAISQDLYNQVQKIETFFTNPANQPDWAKINAGSSSSSSAASSANSLASALDSAVTALKAFITSLGLSTLSPYTPEQQFELAAAAFKATSVAAAAGDATAISNLPNDAKAYLTAAQAYLGATAGYTEIFNQVLGVLNSILASSSALSTSQNNANNAANQAGGTPMPALQEGLVKFATGMEYYMPLGSQLPPGAVWVSGGPTASNTNIPGSPPGSNGSVGSGTSTTPTTTSQSADTQKVVDNISIVNTTLVNGFAKLIDAINNNNITANNNNAAIARIGSTRIVGRGVVGGPR